MDIYTFARERVPQITATIGLVTFSLLAKKLTPGGIVAGTVVAIIHMLHPWPAIFWLLIMFFVLGTAVTKVRYMPALYNLRLISGTPTNNVLATRRGDREHRR